MATTQSDIYRKRDPKCLISNSRGLKESLRAPRKAAPDAGLAWPCQVRGLRQPVFRNLVLVLLQQMGIPVAFVEGNDGCLLVRGRRLADVLKAMARDGVVVNLEFASQFI